jgi:predicted metal-dependent hydrolase
LAVGTPLEQGINYFNAGRFFEAHEVWEDLWREEHGGLRLFYQGLVQAAVGMHHLSRANLLGAGAQIKKALAKLDRFPAETAGIDVRRFQADLGEILKDPAGHIHNELRICHLK